jgi:hypothetical protein
MTKGKIFLVPLIIGILLQIQGLVAAGEVEDPMFIPLQKKRVLEWRKERDTFFKTHQRSPLTPKEKRNFKGLRYYPFDPHYVFSGQIERYAFHINNPKYYGTFLTNKGTNKRYMEGFILNWRRRIIRLRFTSRS